MIDHRISLFVAGICEFISIQGGRRRWVATSMSPIVMASLLCPRNDERQYFITLQSERCMLAPLQELDRVHQQADGSKVQRRCRQHKHMENLMVAEYPRGRVGPL